MSVLMSVSARWLEKCCSIPCHEAGLFHSVDDAGEAALAVEDSFGELVHAQALGGLLELDEGVVPAHGDSSVALELGVEHIDQCERALEVEAPGAQPLGGGA